MIDGIKTVAVLLAAGNGKRMRIKENKVYLDLDGQPSILYPLQAFEDSDVDEIIIMAARRDIDYVKEEILAKHQFSKVTSVVAGGRERYESVYFGLQEAENHITKEEKYVLIHDAARVFLTADQINECIRQVARHKACVMGMPVKDTIRLIDSEHYGVETIPRSAVWIVQTPQCFVLSEIKEAFDQMMASEDNDITDDVMVMERYGNRRVKMIEGGYDNIKITTIEDLPVGEAILQKRRRMMAD